MININLAQLCKISVPMYNHSGRDRTWTMQVLIPQPEFTPDKIRKVVGKMVKANLTTQYDVGDVFLDCSVISGWRYYTLFRLNSDGMITTMAKKNMADPDDNVEWTAKIECGKRGNWETDVLDVLDCHFDQGWIVSWGPNIDFPQVGRNIEETPVDTCNGMPCVDKVAQNDTVLTVEVPRVYTHDELEDITKLFQQKRNLECQANRIVEELKRMGAWKNEWE